MGDRTTVTLTVLNCQSEEAENLFTYASDETINNARLKSYTFYEVNYGNLGFLENLIEAGIAFDSHWEDGSDYGSGTDSCRFTFEGALVRKEIYDSQHSLPINALLPRIEKPDELVKYILAHTKFLEVLKLDEDQIHNGKLYRTKRLIGMPT